MKTMSKCDKPYHHVPERDRRPGPKKGQIDKLIRDLAGAVTDIKKPKGEKKK